MSSREAAVAIGRVCLIGGGSSGIVAAKIFADHGIPFDGFELGSDIGGIWRFQNDSGRSPAYASLETNTSTVRTEYACFPWQGGRPRFVPNEELLGYFEDFADRFDVRDGFRFRTEVTSVAHVDDQYDVTWRSTDTGEEGGARYSAVVVAAGHHWDARLPDFAGDFDGDLLHSRDYRTPTEPVSVADRRVLVVGIGNSACDITCDVAEGAAQTVLSTRSGAHVLPKMLLGRPIDLWITPLTSRLPVRVQGTLLDLLVRLGRGDQRKFGIPRPDRRLGEEHPTLSQNLPSLVASDRVEMKPNVSAVQGQLVQFADGTEAEFDIMICATGYHVAFPYLSEELLGNLDPHGVDERADAVAGGRPGGRIFENLIRLYHHVVAPTLPGLYFLGLVQPLGAIPPLAEAQAHWVAELITGHVSLPPQAEMFSSIFVKERELSRRFVSSSRHTLEVDIFPYRRLIRQERALGRLRAAGSHSPGRSTA